MKKTVKILLLGLFALALHACSFSTDSSKENTEQTGPEYTSAYICPMHCAGSGSETEGTCPVCGMDYEKNEAHNEDAHEH